MLKFERRLNGRSSLSFLLNMPDPNESLVLPGTQPKATQRATVTLSRANVDRLILPGDAPNQPKSRTNASPLTNISQAIQRFTPAIHTQAQNDSRRSSETALILPGTSVTAQSASKAVSAVLPDISRLNPIPTGISSVRAIVDLPTVQSTFVFSAHASPALSPTSNLEIRDPSSSSAFYWT